MVSESKELFSEKATAGSRTYFFDVKESSQNAKYLVISESQPTKKGAFKHHRVMIFEDHIEDFTEGMKNALRFLKRKSAE